MGEHASLAPLLSEVTRRTGLRIDDGHAQRLARVLAELPDDVADRLGQDPRLTDVVVDAVTIDESYFFRHRAQLHHLRETILPRLTDERPPGHRLQLWSAGCADGEEAYTLAIVLAETRLDARADVLATDLSAAALERARTATYTRWALRSPEVAARPQLFTPAGRRYRLSPDVARRVTFRQHNLAGDAYPEPASGGGFDVILCRNVLLHLAPEVVGGVLRRLTAALAPGGWLLTAPADPTPLDDALVEELEPVVLPTGGVVHRRRHPADADTGVRRAHPAPAPARRDRPATDRRRTAPSATSAPPPATARTASDGPPPTAATGATGGSADGRERCVEARRLLTDGRPADAAREAMAAAFLAPDLPAAHLTLGVAAAAAGQRAVAGRAFRRAADVLAGLAPDEPVELCDGETAGALMELARAHALLHDEGAA